MILHIKDDADILVAEGRGARLNSPLLCYLHNVYKKKLMQKQTLCEKLETFKPFRVYGRNFEFPPVGTLKPSHSLHMVMFRP